jgi:hypothetical protein
VEDSEKVFSESSREVFARKLLYLGVFLSKTSLEDSEK